MFIRLSRLEGHQSGSGGMSRSRESPISKNGTGGAAGPVSGGGSETEKHIKYTSFKHLDTRQLGVPGSVTPKRIL